MKAYFNEIYVISQYKLQNKKSEIKTIFFVSWILSLDEKDFILKYQHFYIIRVFLIEKFLSGSWESGGLLGLILTMLVRQLSYNVSQCEE